SGDSSRNGAPGSSSSSIRSRTSNLPRLRCRSVYLGPPPAIALACSAATSSSLASIAARFAAKLGDLSSIAERSSVTAGPFCGSRNGTGRIGAAQRNTAEGRPLPRAALRVRSGLAPDLVGVSEGGQLVAGELAVGRDRRGEVIHVQGAVHDRARCSLGPD